MDAQALLPLCSPLLSQRGSGMDDGQAAYKGVETTGFQSPARTL